VLAVEQTSRNHPGAPLARQEVDHMTIVRGVRILAAPCCGARYKFPNYVSMNFSAFEYWTDGWREFSPMPNDEGLRRCQCGQFVLLKELVEIETAETSELPRIDHVPAELLPECIAQASGDDLELAARLGYWRHLNHPYRERYRQHREAEEAATKAAWEAANPDRRTWWDKLRGRKASSYSRPPGSPFTYPAFEPTQEQLQNMKRLSEILVEQDELLRRRYTLELAELCREQGYFDQAEHVILTIDDRDVDVTSKLIASLIKEKQAAPMRYRM
jgi:hypothetical protein